MTRILRRGAGASRGLVADVFHAVLPSDCRICGGPMLGLRPVRVCNACADRVKEAGEGRQEAMCRRCGDALGMESVRFAGAHGVEECTACRLAPPAFERAVSYAAYNDDLREMLHALKFGGMRQVAEHVIGDWMAEALLKLEGEAATHLLVVPVPLFAGRQRERGFNQAALLARAAVKRLARRKPWWKLELRPELLQRVRETAPQAALNPSQRRKNLKGAFAAGSTEVLRGREVVLIDDILTTGATARECARVLLKAGAVKVWVVTVARAQPESVRAVEQSVARWDVE